MAAGTGFRYCDLVDSHLRRKRICVDTYAALETVFPSDSAYVVTSLLSLPLQLPGFLASRAQANPVFRPLHSIEGYPQLYTRIIVH